MREHLRLHPARILSRAEFAVRAAWFASAAGLFLALSLGLGVLGYHTFAGFTWVDSLLNAAMILTGMGPVSQLPTDQAKIFATAYAVYSGLAFTSVSAILLYPFVQRMVQFLHAAPPAAESEDGAPPPHTDAPPSPGA